MPFHPQRGFRRALLDGSPKLGVLFGTNSPQILEVCGFVGCDYVWLDLEHGDGMDVAGTAGLIRAADAARVPALVRVARGAPDVVARVLDQGALGVCFPHLATAEEARLAVRSVKYAPQGERSVHPYVRATEFVGGPAWSEYWQTANDETLVIGLVEDREGLENIDEIAAVPGLDVLWLGIADLTQSLGIPGETTHPLILAARLRYEAAAKRNGLALASRLEASAAVPSEERESQVRELLDRGYRLLYWVDTLMYAVALKSLFESARAATGTPRS
jgi:4-hydroxy-2-oxoheptanedioate aldolase